MGWAPFHIRHYTTRRKVLCQSPSPLEADMARALLKTQSNALARFALALAVWDADRSAEDSTPYAHSVWCKESRLQPACRLHFFNGST